MGSAMIDSSLPAAGPEETARRGRRHDYDVGSANPDRLLRTGRGRLLYRFEAHERRLMIERRLQEVHLGLQQIALRLRDEERRREPDVVAPLLVGVSLLPE